MALAYGAVQILKAQDLTAIPRLAEVSIDAATLGFAHVSACCCRNTRRASSLICSCRACRSTKNNASMRVTIFTGHVSQCKVLKAFFKC